MKILISFLGAAFVLIGIAAAVMAPDMLAMAIIAVMIVVVLLGFLFGMLPVAGFFSGFRKGRESIEEALSVQSDSPWIAVQQNTDFFHQRILNGMFADYIRKAAQQAQDGLEPGNLEDIINDDSLAIRSWQSLVQQIPGTLTALGLLGTFVGLITGISSIGFSSVDAALGSIEVLLAGIRTAFYTSVIGVIFSILFNISSKTVWNLMLRELGYFMEQFHMYVVPSTDEQARLRHTREMKSVMECLNRIPSPKEDETAAQPLLAPDGTPVPKPGESQLMEDVREGLKNNEFIFYLQPRYNLITQEIVAGEALLRWKNKKLGIVPSSSFLPIVEENGFIVRIDNYIWESVFQTIHSWLENGLRPIPISVNLSKADVMSMDVAFFFTSMSHKYQVPPRYVDIELSQSAYLECEETVREAETQLRQAGFRVIIDDFDGNFAAMNLLSSCHADAIKMDLRTKSIEDVEELYEQTQRMHFPIIVESIETSKQLGAIRQCGCTEGQGFYFCRPIPVEEFEQNLGQSAAVKQE